MNDDLLPGPSPPPETPPPPPTPTPRAELAARIDDDLDDRARAFEKATRRVFHGADDEAIHDLRVATRRLDEGLGVWRTFLEPKSTRACRAALDRLRRRMSAPRDAEVLHGLISDLPERHEPEVAPIAEMMLERLERRRTRGRQRAAKAVRGKRVARLLEKLKEARAPLFERVARLADPMRDPLARADRRRERAETALAQAVGSEDDGVLHEARIAVKKDRYAAECLESIGRAKDPGRSARLRALQTSLGTIQDGAVARAWVSRLERKSIARGRLATAAVLARLGDALSERRRSALARFAQTLAAGPRAVPAPLVPGGRAGLPAGPSADAPPRSPDERLPETPRAGRPPHSDA
jgi:CHAD domain-containing protein